MKEYILNQNLNLSHQEYRNIDAFSSHLLMGYAESGVSIFKEREPKESQALNLGSAVDTYLLDNSKFNDLFAVSKVKLTGQLLDLYNYINNLYYPVYQEIPSIEKLLDISSELGLFGSIKDPIKRREKLTPEFLEALVEIPNLMGKTLISEDDDIFIKTASAFIEKKLYNELLSNDKLRINHYQLKRDVLLQSPHFIPSMFTFKGEIDQLEVDFEKKLVRIIDIKTGIEPAHKFEVPFYKYKYWIQSTIYTMLVRDLKIGIDDFNIQCRYIYISKNGVDNPVIYDLNPKWYDYGMLGWKSRYGTDVKGVADLANELKWHFDNQLFDYPREYYDNGKFLIDLP